MKHCLVFSFVFSHDQLIIKVIFRGINFFRTKRGRLFEGRRLFEGGDYCPRRDFAQKAKSRSRRHSSNSRVYYGKYLQLKYTVIQSIWKKSRFA